MVLQLESLWTYMIELDILGLVQAIFVGTVGEIFYGVLTLCILLIIYGKTKSVTYVAILWVFLGAILIPLLPAAGWGITAILLYLSLGTMVAYLFIRTVK